MIEKYLDSTGKKIVRSQIASDVKNGNISNDEIDNLLDEIKRKINSNEIENPFIHSRDNLRKDKSNWTSYYLDMLVAMSSAGEWFDEEYLLYLQKVAKYVNSKYKRLFIKAIAVILIAFVGFGSGFLVSRKFNNFAEQKEQLEKLKAENESLTMQVNELKNLPQQVEDLKNKTDNYKAIFMDIFERIAAEIPDDVLQSELEKRNVTSVPPSTSASSKSTIDFGNDELGQLMNEALLGDVSEKFNKSKFLSTNVEERALEKKATKEIAQKLFDNMKLNKDKFHIEKF